MWLLLLVAVPGIVTIAVGDQFFALPAGMGAVPVDVVAPTKE